MKKVYIKIDRKRAGTACLIPEHREDFWHIYNIAAAGDVLKASTFRKVQKVNTFMGNGNSQRIKLTLSILVETIDLDLDDCSIRFSGKNQTISEYIQLNQYHTIEVRVNNKFHLTKEEWDTFHRERLRTSLDAALDADLAVFTMQQGLANLYLVSPHISLFKSKIEVSIPKKRNYSAKRHNKALENFYTKILTSIETYVNFEVVKCVVIASPGFYKDEFRKWLKEKVDRENNLFIKEHIAKFLYCHTSTGYKAALDEIMTNKEIQKSITSTKVVQDKQLFEEFLKELMTGKDRAIYGLKHVEKAARAKAVKDLMVSDDFVRGSNIDIRKRVEALSKVVKRNSGAVHVFSALSSIGEKLLGLTGCAALLNFPISDLSSDEE